jgi:hypothetical protein
MGWSLRPGALRGLPLVLGRFPGCPEKLRSGDRDALRQQSASISLSAASGTMEADKRPDSMPPDILIDFDHFYHFTLVELARYVAKAVKRPNRLCSSKIQWARDPDSLASGRRYWAHYCLSLAPSAILKCAEINPAFLVALEAHNWLATRKQAPKLLGGESVEEVCAQDSGQGAANNCYHPVVSSQFPVFWLAHRTLMLQLLFDSVSGFTAHRLLIPVKRRHLYKCHSIG